MSTDFSDSPHYQCKKIRISGLELWQIGKDWEGNRLTHAAVRSHVSERYQQTPSVSNECNQLHTSTVSCQDLTAAPARYTRYTQCGHPDFTRRIRPNLYKAAHFHTGRPHLHSGRCLPQCALGHRSSPATPDIHRHNDKLRVCVIYISGSLTFRRRIKSRLPFLGIN